MGWNIIKITHIHGFERKKVDFPNPVLSKKRFFTTSIVQLGPFAVNLKFLLFLCQNQTKLTPQAVLSLPGPSPNLN
jgi:hypothetical protein